MGIYINKGNIAFEEVLNSKYVDKSSFIAVVNASLKTENKFICATRCRRFGKSMMAKMLCAYYDKSCDSRKLFEGLKISTMPNKDDKGNILFPSFEEYLNKFNVIYLDVTDFTTQPDYKGRLVKSMQEEIMEEVKQTFPKVSYKENSALMGCLQSIYTQTGERFYFIIDEWDAICREFPKRRKFKDSPESVEPTEMDEYVKFLRRLFKGGLSSEVFVGAYITGILPMIKYNTESALNNFREYSMVNPRKAPGSFGFTSDEVRSLCEKYNMDYDEMAAWYDGYQIGKEPSVFNPHSVMNAIEANECCSFWASTGAYDKVAKYISLNYDGLKDDIIKMLAGERCRVNTTKFKNDISKVESRDDVLTVLIHLGYLAYDGRTGTCYIPN